MTKEEDALLRQTKPRLNAHVLLLDFCELRVKDGVQPYKKMSLSEGSGNVCWQRRCFAGDATVTSAWWAGLFSALKMEGEMHRSTPLLE